MKFSGRGKNIQMIIIKTKSSTWKTSCTAFDLKGGDLYTERIWENKRATKSVLLVQNRECYYNFLSIGKTMRGNAL